MLIEWKSRNFLLAIIFLQFIVYITVFFDVPVTRQVIGFTYLTFVPGFVILKLLKMDDRDEVETLLFMVGLSVAFLMFTGLAINELGPLFGVSKPLSLMSLMIIINSLILIGGVLLYVRNKNIKILRIEPIKVFPLKFLFLILPLLSVIGAMWVNSYENNLILLFTIIVITLLFGLVAISRSLPPKIYPLVVVTIAISLLLHSSLISTYLLSHGSDIPGESFLSRTTKNNAHWSLSSPYPGDESWSRLNSMLSITILPAIYSSLLNMDVSLVLKIVYPLIFSLIPLTLYQLWQKFFEKKKAIIATFLFMAQSTFFTEMLGLGRQMIAELFFALLLLIIAETKMSSFKKNICFIIFSTALVVSHYGLAYIFIIFISVTWFILFALKKSSVNITITKIFIFFVLTFFWYLYTSDSAVFTSFVSFSNYVLSQFDEFFNLGSRGQDVLRGLGLEKAPSIWNIFSRVVAYITEFLIAVGFVGLITKRVKINISREIYILIIIAASFLGSLILVPGLANTMNITRFYHILLFFLAPLYVLGAEVLVKLVYKKEKEFIATLVLIIVLIPYLLFQTGFVYEVAGSESWSVPLSKYRMDGYKLYRENGYIDDLSVYSARWLYKNVDYQNNPIYADLSSMYNVLTSYGHIYRGYIKLPSNTTIYPKNTILYFSPLNIIHGIVVGKSYLYNFTNLSVLDASSKIYSNGGCEIHKTFEIA